MSTELIDLEFMSSDIRLIIYSLMGDYTAEMESMGIKAIRSIHSCMETGMCCVLAKKLR